ncbi:uncharacterized protein isoform X2 [Musca autumnalis]
MRDRYLKLYSDMIATNGEPSDVSWRLFPHMHFLKDQLQTKRSIWNIDCVEEEGDFPEDSLASIEIAEEHPLPLDGGYNENDDEDMPIFIEEISPPPSHPTSSKVKRQQSYDDEEEEEEDFPVSTPCETKYSQAPKKTPTSGILNIPANRRRIIIKPREDSKETCEDNKTTISNNITSSRKRPFDYQDEDLLSRKFCNLAEEFLKYAQNQQATAPPPSQHEPFYKMLEQKLNKLPEQQQDSIKMRILNYVFEYTTCFQNGKPTKDLKIS